MLSRKHRFHGLGSLRFVYKNGQTVRSGSLAVRYRHNPRRQSYRCSVVVSKKTEKSAVRRNRLRRRIYEIVRLSEPMISQPYDIIITVFNADVANISPVELGKLVTDLLARAGITKK